MELIQSIDLKKFFATKEELNDKQDILVSSGTGQNIKTVNGNNLLGNGDIVIKPKINNVELDGDKSSSDLGLASATHTHSGDDITDLNSIIESKVKNMLNEYFDDKCASVKIENGKLIVDKWKSGDFDDE